MRSNVSNSILGHYPPVRRLQRERDALRGEHNSMQLKLRAASAEMGVLEEQCRVLQAERDRLRIRATQTADYERQAARLRVALAAGQDVALRTRRWTKRRQHRSSRFAFSQVAARRLAAPDRTPGLFVGHARSAVVANPGRILESCRQRRATDR